MKAGIFTTTIETVLDLGEQETRHFKLLFDPETLFDFEAGQFINIMLQKDGKQIKRPYSIASPPIWKGYIELCWKRVPHGLVTNELWNFKSGDKLQIQGPLGRFTVRQPMAKNIYFVSTGTGIAPFRAMIHTLLKHGTQSQLWNIFGNRFDDDILYQKEFEELAAKYSNFHNAFTVSRPKKWTGEKRYVQWVLQDLLKNPADSQVYICGLSNMIAEVNQVAQQAGLAKEQIFFEKYD